MTRILLARHGETDWNRLGRWQGHDLRHRRITIWHQSGVPARELAERAGHERLSMSLDTYSHVVPPDEIAPSGSCRRSETTIPRHTGAPPAQHLTASTVLATA